MRSLQLDVPDEVYDRLVEMARLEGIPVEEMAIQLLGGPADVGTNAELLASLPDLGLTPAQILDALHAERR
ncbi:antitoxin [Nakamurella sp. YIM 132087]|uniref:Antitoxin n=1 Tax=Nakamurella alba TaxID=2665158 RepID=A0A7K1FLS6_9ACTN|nr:antitoxin [Nakamurella alba]MTD15105.1 antitoxin [Nakamurella alba]